MTKYGSSHPFLVVGSEEAALSDDSSLVYLANKKTWGFSPSFLLCSMTQHNMDKIIMLIHWIVDNFLWKSLSLCNFSFNIFFSIWRILPFYSNLATIKHYFLSWNFRHAISYKNYSLRFVHSHGNFKTDLSTISFMIIFFPVRENGKRSEARWMKTVLASGTLSDKMAALTLLVQESPLHSMSSLESLISMAAKKGKRESMMAVGKSKN